MLAKVRAPPVSCFSAASSGGALCLKSDKVGDLRFFFCLLLFDVTCQDYCQSTQSACHQLEFYYMKCYEKVR